MPTIIDPEFGEIVIKKNALARNVSLKIAPDGRLRISMPTYAPLFSAKMLVKSSRKQIRSVLKQHHQAHTYAENQQIGKSHNLIFLSGETFAVKRNATRIVVNLPDDSDRTSPPFQQAIRREVVSALRKEAKAYLPRRVEMLASQNGYNYEVVKLTHASSRWGSCSSKGTISLNIGLMNLPFELLDYVICHELAHTVYMNHSPSFWREVEKLDPNYQEHRKKLKNYSPHI